MVMDMRPLVKFTYEMEGDRLEGLLLVEKMEELRSMGCQIKSCAPASSPTSRPSCAATSSSSRAW